MAPTPTDYTQMTKREIVFSFSVVTCLFFLWGFSYGLLDVLNAHFLAFFHLTRTQTTLLQFAYFIAYLVVAPPMGIFMRKFGYKLGIHVGLGLFSLGAILFWPAAKFEHYGMFVAFTFIIASGLATLEVAANTFITVLGPPEYASFRLTLAQGFNGIATIVGPLIASHAFFTGKNSESLGSVQYVYLAMCILGCIVNVLIFFAKLPEIQQVVAQDAKAIKPSVAGFVKAAPHTIFGALAEFAYVGAQVAVASNVIFYLTLQPGISPKITNAQASNMFSGCQAVFTVGRFIGVIYLRYVDPSLCLFVHGVGLVVFTLLTAVLPGKAGVACLFIIFFFESICYPVIFSVATADLGVYNKLGGGLIAAGVSGGAVWPAMQTAVSEAKGSSEHISMLIPMAGFVPLAIYGLAMWMVRTRKYNGGVYSWKVIHPPLETAVDANLEESYESTGIPHTGAAEIKEEAEYKENKY